MANKKDTDLQRIKELIEIMKENELVELEIKHEDDKIFLKRSQPQPAGLTAVPMVGAAIPAVPANTAGVQNSALQPESAGPPCAEEELVEMKSPLVGTFYAAASPDSEPYVEVGSTVNSQTVVCIIEAMKVMNEVKAETSGTVIDVLVKNGQAVEYGQVLFKVRPD
ncbi:MAG: acetyl-CoA carboxylase biotin carboxyl carrier protein [Planctomycetota bacterium]|jgi:acetyl-CoA carboxylase biotin carboxyl carrier protein